MAAIDLSARPQDELVRAIMAEAAELEAALTAFQKAADAAATSAPAPADAGPKAGSWDAWARSAAAKGGLGPEDLARLARANAESGETDKEADTEKVAERSSGGGAGGAGGSEEDASYQAYIARHADKSTASLRAWMKALHRRVLLRCHPDKRHVVGDRVAPEVLRHTCELYLRLRADTQPEAFNDCRVIRCAVLLRVCSRGPPEEDARAALRAQIAQMKQIAARLRAAAN